MAAKSESVGYRRGVVLGFTVAEVVLLFVFCLLLLLAPTIEVLEAATGQQPPASSDTAGGNPSVPPPPSQRPNSQEHNPGSISNEKRQRAEEARRRWSDIPPDWKVLVEGEPAYIPAVAVCEMTGLSNEDCTPGKIQDVLRGSGEHNWPPIIRLREADGYFFAVGSAGITEEFLRKIKDDVIPNLVKTLSQYKVDVIEVVGHTDEQPVQGKATNLDAVALDVVRRGASATKLIAGDNAGLGFARAISIVQVLGSDSRLGGYTIIPLSAAHLVDTSGKLSDGRNPGDTKERRRIEIRVRRSDTGPAPVVTR